MKTMTWMIAVLLAGCSGGDVTIISRPGPLPEPVADTFIAQVTKVVASMPEDAEAAAIDSMAATAPEDSDPPAL